MRTTKAYSYQRFSSPEQSKGDSLRRQNAALQQFLDRNGLQLDDSLRFVDAGVSGFKGRHRANDTTALGHFLDLVKKGSVPRGSYFIVENLDRLSREDVSVALELLLGLLNAGIRVVQLSPSEVIFERGAEPVQLIIAIIELSRGNSESRMKSVRMTAAWEAKQNAARTSRTAISSQCPRWLRRDGDRYVTIPERVETVRRIFQLASEGCGLQRIIQTLVKERRDPMGYGKKWRITYLHKMLRGRAVLGEYQPRRGGVDRGEPILDYYPAVISEELYYAARRGLAERLRYRGRSSPSVNLFAGLLYSAISGDSYIYGQRASHHVDKRRYTSSTSREGLAKRSSFPVEPFDTALLRCLAELPAIAIGSPLRDSEPNEGKTPTELLESKLSEVIAKLTRIEERIYAGEDLDLLVAAAKRLQTERSELQRQLDAARTEQSVSAAERVAACQSLIEQLEAAPDKELARLQLRSAIRRVVRRIDCIFARCGLREAAFVHVHFHDSDYTRAILIRYRSRLTSGGKRKKPAHLSFETKTDGLFAASDTIKQREAILRTLQSLVEEENWIREVEPDLPSLREWKAAYMRAYRKRD